jgi:hypothetical protein
MVIVAIRIGEGSKPAVMAGAHLAERLGVQLRLLYVAEELEAVDELARAAGQTVAEARKRLLEDIEERCREELGSVFPGPGHLLVRQGKLPEQVALAAKENGAQLERAPCPVVVIPPAITHGKG